MTNLTFPFQFDPPLRVLARLFGVTPRTAWVSVNDETLEVQFGRWRLRTPLDNVSNASVTGPYHWWKIAGPPHLSLVDKGVTFGTSRSQGLCIAFVEPVAAMSSSGRLLHPAATVTVEDPQRLLHSLAAAREESGPLRPMRQTDAR
jgi:hypothetical protein